MLSHIILDHVHCIGYPTSYWIMYTVQGVPHHSGSCTLYRVSHIILDRVSALNWDYKDSSENLKRTSQLTKLAILLIYRFACRKYQFIEYYVRILALKIGDNPTWFGTLYIYRVTHKEWDFRGNCTEFV